MRPCAAVPVLGVEGDKRAQGLAPSHRLQESAASDMAALLEEITAAEKVVKREDDAAAERKRAELEAEEKRKAAEAEKRREEEAAKKAKEEVCPPLPLPLPLPPSLPPSSPFLSLPLPPLFLFLSGVISDRTAYPGKACIHTSALWHGA